MLRSARWAPSACRPCRRSWRAISPLHSRPGSSARWTPTTAAKGRAASRSCNAIDTCCRSECERTMSGDEPMSSSGPAATAAAAPAPLYPAERAPVARRSAKAWLALVIQGLAGAVGGFLGIQWLDRLIGGLDLGLLLLGLGALVVVGWLQVLVHEAGHALAGALVGRRFVGAGIGPLQVDRGAGGRLTFRWARGIRGIAGYAVMLPRAREPSSAERRVRYASDGGVA